MKTSLLTYPWRKTASPSASVRGGRSRRNWHLDLGLMEAGSDEDGDGAFDGSWHESSRTLAMGLQVTEWAGSLETLTALSR